MGRLGNNPSSRGYATPTYSTTQITARETFGGPAKAGLGRHIGMGEWTFGAIVNGSSGRSGHTAPPFAGMNFPAAFQAGRLPTLHYPISKTNQLARIGVGTTGGMTRTPADGVNPEQRKNMQLRTDAWNQFWPARPIRDTPNNCCNVDPVGLGLYSQDFIFAFFFEFNNGSREINLGKRNFSLLKNKLFRKTNTFNKRSRKNNTRSTQTLWEYLDRPDMVIMNMTMREFFEIGTREDEPDFANFNEAYEYLLNLYPNEDWPSPSLINGKQPVIILNEFGAGQTDDFADENQYERGLNALYDNIEMMVTTDFDVDESITVYRINRELLLPSDGGGTFNDILTNVDPQLDSDIIYNIKDAARNLWNINFENQAEISYNDVEDAYSNLDLVLDEVHILMTENEWIRSTSRKARSREMLPCSDNVYDMLADAAEDQIKSMGLTLVSKNDFFGKANSMDCVSTVKSVTNDGRISALKFLNISGD